MKLKKGIYLLCSMLLLVFTNVTASAAGNSHITCSKATCKHGDSVSIVCNVDNNSGLAAWLINVSFDNDNFDFKSAKAGEAFSGGTFMATQNENGDVVLMWYSTKNNNNNGEMFTLEFAAHDNATVGTYPVTFTCSEPNTIDESGNTVILTADNGTIEIESQGNGSTSSGSSSSRLGRTKNGTTDNDVSDNLEQNSETAEQDSSTENNITFNDVSENEYYYDSVMWAVKNGITVGTGEGTFSPGDVCTRAQAVTFLWRTAGSPEPALTTGIFQDVGNDDYYYKAVMWALENGITEGTGNDTFSPHNTVTRAQIVTFMWRLAGDSGSAATNTFADVKENDYFYKAVLWATSKEITKGTGDETFSPQSGCTRAQMVTFLYRYNNLDK